MFIIVISKYDCEYAFRKEELLAFYGAVPRGTE
jgi:hypothetical protein